MYPISGAQIFRGHPKLKPATTTITSTTTATATAPSRQYYDHKLPLPNHYITKKILPLLLPLLLLYYYYYYYYYCYGCLCSAYSYSRRQKLGMQTR